MQYPFTEEQRALSDLVRDFMQREVAPVAAEIDARPDPKDCYPKESLRKASELGLRTMAIPEEYGGMGASMMDRTLSIWTGGQVEIGVVKCLSQCWKVSSLIAKGGNQEQKDRWLRRFAEDDDFVCSIASTEPDHSTENRLTVSDPKQGLQTTAVKDGDYYVINGAKRYTSLIGFSKVILFSARTDPKAPVNEGTTYFLLGGTKRASPTGGCTTRWAIVSTPTGRASTTTSGCTRTKYWGN